MLIAILVVLVVIALAIFRTNQYLRVIAKNQVGIFKRENKVTQ